MAIQETAGWIWPVSHSFLTPDLTNIQELSAAPSGPILIFLQVVLSLPFKHNKYTQNAGLTCLLVLVLPTPPVNLLSPHWHHSPSSSLILFALLFYTPHTHIHAFFFVFFFFFLVVLRGMQDLSSPVRDWTHAPWLPGNSLIPVLLNCTPAFSRTSLQAFH